jgi:hypothetical protein
VVARAEHKVMAAAVQAVLSFQHLNLLLVLTL